MKSKKSFQSASAQPGRGISFSFPIVALIVVALFGLSFLIYAAFSKSTFEGAARIIVFTGVTFVLGVFAISCVSILWLKRISDHPLLRSDEKLQNKDALVIATGALLALLLGLCVTGAGAALLFPTRQAQAAFLSILAALAALAVGGAFGFLLGHPRRMDGDPAKNDRTSSSWLLKTGLDDIVDWLVKGITTVLLVEAKKVLTVLDPLAHNLGRALAGADLGKLPLSPAAQPPLPDASGDAFSFALIVYFVLFGTGATCLVTRTYLTGALGRADRSNVNAFSQVGLHWGEILTFIGNQRSLGTRQGKVGAEVMTVATKLAALSLADLRTPQEFALWAKAKSMLGESEEALRGFEKAVLQTDCNPSLLLDYAVALSSTGDIQDALARLEQARRCISEDTPGEVRKNIFKSLTFALLYEPSSYDRVITLIKEYFALPCAPASGGLRVNEVCAYGQRLLHQANANGMLRKRTPSGILCIEPMEPEKWPREPSATGDPAPLPGDLTGFSMMDAYQGGLNALKLALQQDPGWKGRLASLLTHGAKGSDEDDLSIFESYPEFRKLLGLPPLSNEETQPYTLHEQAASDPEERASEVIPTQSEQTTGENIAVQETETANQATTAPVQPPKDQA